MDTGHVISGVGHLGFVGWMLLGGIFSSTADPVQVQEVAMISGEEYQALLDAQQPPDQVTDVVQPAAPQVIEDAPDVAASEEAPPEQPAPQPVEIPQVEAPPVEDTPPPEPQIAEEAPLSPDPPSEVTVLVPELSTTRPVPRPAERVAPEAVVQPDPDTTPDDVEQAAVVPDAQGETPEDLQEATAPQEATTETVTEATEAPAASPTQSARPPARRPSAPQVAETAPTADAPNDTDEAVRAALEAAASSAQTEVPTGPPMSAGEKDILRLGVSNCWNVGSLSSAALATTVVVSVQMAQTGKPINGSIKMVSKSGGSDAAAKQAFEAARRAIIRCGSKGFELPAEKYGQWQSVEMTFDPTRMRIK